MGLIIAASVIAFVTTEMDDLLIMFVLFCKASRSWEKAAIMLGKYIGLFLLVAIGKLFSSFLSIIPSEQLLGLLGIMPIVIGIRYAVKEFAGEKDNEGDLVIRSFSFFILTAETVIITLASGGDNIAVCVSFFSSLKKTEFIYACIVFFVLQAAWCVIAISVMGADSIRNYIEESKSVIIPALFIVLGFYILIKSGTFVWIFSGNAFS